MPELTPNLGIPIPPGGDSSILTRTIRDALLALDATFGVRTLALAPSMMTSGSLTIQRSGNVVALHADALVMSTTAGGTVFTLPVGWRPAATRPSLFAGLSSRAQVTQFGFVQFYNWTAGTRIDGTLTWLTTDPLPTT